MSGAGQLLVNSLFYVAGYLLLGATRSLGSVVQNLLAFVTGTALWGAVCLLLMVAHIPLTMLTAVLAMASVIGALAWLTRRQTNRPVYGLRRRQLRSFLIGFTAFVAANVVLLTHFYVIQTTDSYIFLVNGHLIANAHRYPSELPGLWLFTFPRMSQLPMLLAAGALVGVERYHSLFPLLGLNLVALTVAAIWGFFGCQLGRWSRACLAAIGALLMLSNNSFVYHSFYIHNNLLTATYFFCGFLAVVAYQRTLRLALLGLAGLSLGAAALTRVESLQFAALPILCLLVARQRPSRRGFGYLTLVFLFIAGTWAVYRSWLEGFGRGYHGWGLADLLTLACYPLLWLAVSHEWTWQRPARHTAWLALAVTVLAVGLTATLYPKAMGHTIDSLWQLIWHGAGHTNWGLGWIPVLAALPLSWLFKSPPLRMASYFVTLFLLLRILLYSLPIASGLQHLSSGSRLLVHAYPVAVLVLMGTIAALLQRADSLLRQVHQTGCSPAWLSRASRMLSAIVSR